MNKKSTSMIKASGKVIEAGDMGNLTISQIDKFGSNVQSKIDTEMGEIISHYRTFDAGEAGEQLNELALVANSSTNKLGKIGPMFGIRKFMGRFDTVENKLEQLVNGIEKTKDRLDMVMESMLESRQMVATYIGQFGEYEQQLVSYKDSLLEATDTDELRVQAVVNRLKVMTGSRVVAEQSYVETTLLIGQTQEVQHQIDEMLTNIVPIFKMKLVNALGIKAHKDALALKERVTKVSEKLIIDNAKNIEKNTELMLENRQRAIISPETLMEANQILQRVVLKAVETCSTERQANEEVIRRLNEASTQLRESSQGLNAIQDQNQQE